VNKLVGSILRWTGGASSAQNSKITLIDIGEILGGRPAHSMLPSACPRLRAGPCSQAGIVRLIVRAMIAAEVAAMVASAIGISSYRPFASVGLSPARASTNGLYFTDRRCSASMIFFFCSGGMSGASASL